MQILKLVRAGQCAHPHSLNERIATWHTSIPRAANFRIVDNPTGTGVQQAGMAICGLPDMLGKESSKKSGPDDSVGYKLTLNWDAKMEIPANILEPRSLYELCWTYALRSMFAFDTASGELVAGNLAAEELVGFSIEELLGRDITVLHPMEERFRIKAEFQKAGWKPYPLLGFHIQRKDGRCSRVVIWSSKPLVQGSLSLVIYAYFGIPSPEEPKHSI